MTLFLLGYLQYIGKEGRGLTIAFAIFGFWLLDIANNTLQGPCRTIIADLAPMEQQRLGNAYFSLWSSLGNVVGFLICYIPWSTFLYFTKVRKKKLQST